MAKNYVSTDRLTPFLMPPSVMDWLPSDHLALFLVDVVGKLKSSTQALHHRHPNWGPGRAAYDPEMLLTLLLYAYCTGTFSSRHIEAACKFDVAYKVIAANQVPDHTTIARFRADNIIRIADLHSDILALCAVAGMDVVGEVALDGTKMRAAASLKADRTKEQIQKELGELKAAAQEKVDELHRRAASADADDDARLGQARGDELPPHLVEPESREAHLESALELIVQLHEQKLDDERSQRAEATARRLETAPAGQAGRPPLHHSQPTHPGGGRSRPGSRQGTGRDRQGAAPRSRGAGQRQRPQARRPESRS